MSGKSAELYLENAEISVTLDLSDPQLLVMTITAVGV